MIFLSRTFENPPLRRSSPVPVRASNNAGRLWYRPRMAQKQNWQTCQGWCGLLCETSRANFQVPDGDFPEFSTPHGFRSCRRREDRSSASPSIVRPTSLLQWQNSPANTPTSCRHLLPAPDASLAVYYLNPEFGPSRRLSAAVGARHCTLLRSKAEWPVLPNQSCRSTRSSIGT